jgi:hypothetical protein
VGEEPVTYTWATRELPILKAALRRIDAGERPPFDEIREEVGLPADQMDIAIEALTRADYIETAGRYVFQVTERTRRELGSWPSAEGLLEQLTEALSNEVEAEAEPQRKARLSAALDVLTGTGRQIIVDVLSGYVERRLP